MSAVREREQLRAHRDARFEVLVDSPLLRGLSEAQLDDFFALSTVLTIEAPGAAIVREGADSENLYMILSGRAEVTKREAKGDKEFTLATLGPGDHFGETALFEGSKRTATIRALMPMEVLMIRTRQLRAEPGSYSWLAGLLLNLAREGSTRLDRLTHQTVVSLRAELDGNDRTLGFSQMLLYVVGSLSSYAVGSALVSTMATMGWIGAFAQGLLTTGLVVGIGLVFLHLMRSSGYPREFFGVRFAKDWRKELRETLGATAAFVVALTLLKLALIELIPALRGFELLEAKLLDGGQALFVACYVALVPLMELCVRGGLQSSIEESLRGHKHRRRHAIVLSSALLAALHAHVSPLFAIGVFGTGLVWGTIFSRTRSLLGVSIAHAFVAVWALRVLGISQLLTLL